MFRFSTAASLLAAVCALPVRSFAAAPERIALLPLDNLSASEEGPREVAPLLVKVLEGRGWHVTAGEPVEKALDAARVRYLDSVDARTRTALTAALDAGTLALGTVYAYSEAEGPQVALSLRLVGADGGVLCDELVAIRPEDTEGLFEFGKTVTRDELTREALRRLAKLVPKPGEKPRAAHRRGKPLHVSAPVTYRSAALASGTRHRVALLPFANAAFAREAGRVTTKLLARRLADSSLFEVVEAGDVRAALVAEKVRDYSDASQLKKLGARIGTTLFLSGTIYDYAEAPRGGSGTPRLDLQLTLTDASSGEIVWTSFTQRKGTDYRGLLDLGAITNVAALVDQASYEMVHAAEKKKPVRETAPSSTRKASVMKEETKP